MWRDFIIILLCSLIWIVGSRNNGETTTIEGHRDTVRIVRVDTVRIIKPMPHQVRPLRETIEVRVVDTLFMTDTIYRESVVYLPREQRYYSESGLYDIWVSGVAPTLDSLHIYSRNEVTTVRTPTRWALYASLRLGTRGYPTIGLLATTRGRFACGLDVGFSSGAPTYNVTLAYRLFGK